MLESVRKRLRALVKLIDKQKRKPIYTDFEDEMGDEIDVDLPGFARRTASSGSAPRRARSCSEHEDHIAIHKLRMNKPLTPSDLDELERMLTESGVGGAGRRRRRPRRKATAWGCSCARWSGWTARPPRRRSPGSSPARR